MATESLLNFFVNKLGEMTITEAQLQLGIGDDIKFIQDEFSGLKAFLRKVDRMSSMDEVVRELVWQVRDEFFRVEDVLEEFLFRMEIIRSKRPRRCVDIKACFFYMPCLFEQLTLQHHFHYQVETIKKDIANIMNRKDQLTMQQFSDQGGLGMVRDEDDVNVSTSSISTAFMEERDIIGMEEHVKSLEKLMLREEEGEFRKIISIVGMGGVGKTTLANKVYDIVKSKFQYFAWVSVSQVFEEKELLSRIKQGMMITSNSAGDATSTTVSSLQKDIYDHLHGQRYVLVLDDIWDLKAWELVRPALPLQSGCKVMFTTRNETVAAPINQDYYVYKLDLLPPEVARDLFCRKAFRLYSPPRKCPSYLNDKVDAMVKKCNGLPLALVTLGGLMSKRGSNPSKWEDVLKNLDWEINNNSDLGMVKSLLLTSYNYLPSHLKNCFLYCSMFPEDHEFKYDNLIKMWVAEGFVVDEGRKTAEEVAIAYLMELLERNVLQVDPTAIIVPIMGWVPCKVHDILREVAIHVLKKERFAIFIDNVHDDDTIRRGHRFVITQDFLIQNKLLRTNLFAEWNVLPRSLHAFGNYEMLTISVDKFKNGLRMVRVLNLKNVTMPNLPKVVGDLIHLRYLAIGRLIKDINIPTSIGNLRNLQTLDLGRWGTRYKIPSQLTSIHKLRHLICPWVESVVMPLGVKRLSHLQTLSYIEFKDVGVLRELKYLTLLRELSIMNVKGGDYWEELCRCVKQLQQLRVLGINCIVSIDDDGGHAKEMLQLHALSPPPPYLEVLNIQGGIVDQLPKWVASHSCLLRVTLWQCEFKDSHPEEEDHLNLFASTPNLVILHLFECKGIKKMRFGGNEEFLNLRYLSFDGMRELEELEGKILEGSGTMRNLLSLAIDSCKSLKKLPDGLQFLTNLQELKVVRMPRTFIDRYKEGGEDHWMVQHIPKRRLEASK